MLGLESLQLPVVCKPRRQEFTKRGFIVQWCTVSARNVGLQALWFVTDSKLLSLSFLLTVAVAVDCARPAPETLRERVFIYARKPDYCLFNNGTTIMDLQAMFAIAGREWNRLSKPRLETWLLRTGHDEDQKARLEALGNIVIPQCCRHACHLLARGALHPPP